jgi:photosystem II stability/assembly factor-like uncharacterized protein
MSDYRDLLEQERRKFAMRDGTIGGLERRRNRKRRNGQILAGVLALLIAAAGVGGGLFALRSSTGLRPGDRTPTPTPTPPPSAPLGPSAVSSPIQFIDEQHGWMVDGAGQILATVDGGRSWDIQLSGPSNIRAIAFLDAHEGWGVGEGGLIRTIDGVHWETWSNQALSSIQFVTPDLGWGVEGSRDPGLLMRSADGGRTWSAQSLEVNSVCFASDRLGWAAGPHEGGAALFKTEDSGANWSEIPIPLPGGDYTGWSATVRCTEDAAWVLAQGDGGAGHIAYAVFRMGRGESQAQPVLQDAYTHPLGVDKGIPEAANPYPGPFTVADAQIARVLTWCPACGGELPFVSIERTQDGGATWADATIVDSNRPGEPVGITFIDPDNGWVLLGDLIGEQSNKEMVVLRTSDGGQTWGQP